MKAHSEYAIYVALGLMSALVVAFSAAQGAYNFDPHHWGLMLSNATDLARGRTPYKDIFIQYGFLTALAQYLFYSVSSTLISLIIGTSVCYAVGLVGIYFLTLEMTSKKNTSLYATLTAFLIHPLAIYPWPNYIAFPFLVWGCVALVKRPNHAISAFSGGALLGFAVLARETLFLPLFVLVLSLFPIRWWAKSGDKSIQVYFISLAGFLLPLSIFALYLSLAGLLEYWQAIGIELPKLYMSSLFPNGVILAMISLIRDIFSFSSARWFAFGLIISSACLILGHGLLLRGSEPSQNLIIALASGLVITSALHIHEVFRLATSITIGVALPFVLADRVRAAGLLFTATALMLLMGTWNRSDGNYFLPNRVQISTASASDGAGLFAGQRWNAEAFAYYRWFSDAMGDLETRDCGVKFYRNRTADAFISTLSPFRQYQLMPFGTAMGGLPLEAWGSRLRPDYDVSQRLRVRDIVIFDKRPATAPDPAAPEGYQIFDERAAPKSFFIPNGDVTVVMVPVACGQRFGSLNSNIVKR